MYSEYLRGKVCFIREALQVLKAHVHVQVYVCGPVNEYIHIYSSCGRRVFDYWVQEQLYKSVASQKIRPIASLHHFSICEMLDHITKQEIRIAQRKGISEVCWRNAQEMHKGIREKV